MFENLYAYFQRYKENNMATHTISFRDALKFWIKLGFISFGGPAGQIAIMHQEVVERRKWIGENPFLRALNFCMLLPGPEAQQLATYIGWRLHGTLGGIVAGSLFVIPSIFVMLLLSYLAVAHIDIPAVAAAFYGIQPVVVAVVIEAVLRIGKKALKHSVLYAFAALAFVAIFFFIFAGAPFIEAMAGNQGLQAALTGVTAAVVGVVLNLAVWFGYKVILPVSGIDLFAHFYESDNRPWRLNQILLVQYLLRKLYSG